MELNPVKSIHLFMCRVWQEIYSLPITFSRFLFPHFSPWADLDSLGMSKIKWLFILHQKHLFKWPDIFLVGIISCCDAACLNLSPVCFFSWFFFPSLKLYFYSSSKNACCFTVAYLWIFSAGTIISWETWQRTPVQTTQSSSSFQVRVSSLFCLTAQQTLSHPCDKNVDGFIQPGLFLLSFYCQDLYQKKKKNSVTQSHTYCLPF